MVKSTDCSTRGPEFNFQQPHGGLQPSVLGFDVLFWCILGLALLGAVWVKGSTTFGAQLSLELGGISIQPSEFVKITFVLFIASMFYRSLSFGSVAAATGVAAAHVLILVASKDLGSALLFFVTYFSSILPAIRTIPWHFS